MSNFKKFNSSDQGRYNTNYVGREGEVTWDTENGLRLHDGSTEGGNPISGNPFDQNLNQYNSVTFNTVTASQLTYPTDQLGAPTANGNRSAGTKIVLWPEMNVEGHTDYAIGMDAYTQWYSIPAISVDNHYFAFKWYAADNPILQLRGDGLITVAGAINSAADIVLTANTSELRVGTDGTVSLPAQNNSQVSITGSTKTVEGNPYPQRGYYGQEFQIWQASSEDVVGAKVIVRLHNDYSTYTELFEVTIVKEANGNANVSYAVGSRLKSNDSYPDGVIDARLNEMNKLALYHTNMQGDATLYTYDAVEFKKTV